MKPLQPSSDTGSSPTARDLPAIAGGVPVRAPDKALIFGAPCIGEADIAAVSECLRSGWIGTGPRVRQLEEKFAAYKDIPYAAAVSSGTAALHLSMVALGIGPGDEVIGPTMTFCSTIHSILHTGATPILVDCYRDTFNIDVDAIERRISSRTKAIIAVHMCGRCCEMNTILALARKHGLRVIEDCAHAIESTYHGRPAGVLGDVGCFSFYATKNVTTGDGGMVITRDARLARRIKILSLHGMTSDAWSRAVRGGKGYGVVDAGFKCNMTDISAALGLAQMAEVEQRWRRREELWRLYNERLRSLPLTLPAPPDPDCRHAYHLYTPLIVPGSLKVGRNAIITALYAENLSAGIHYVPVHAQPYYRRRFGYRLSDFPNAGFVGRHTLSLPFSPEMSSADVSDVCVALTRILRYYAAEAAPRTSSRKTFSAAAPSPGLQFL